jgi:hypothetical protein
MTAATLPRGILCGLAAALVLAVLVRGTDPGLLELMGGSAADAAYNELADGFRSGQLSLKKDVPAGLAALADPYDPAASAPYRIAPYGVHDLSYYRGRPYVYFGVTPALLLFWPAAVAGHYLFQATAVLIFCAAGFLTAAALLAACWRRYFPEAPEWIAAAGIVALGLAAGAPLLLRRADVWEVPVSCGYALAMLALGAVWLALHRPAQRGRWLAAGSLACGLAVGARPEFLAGAVILLAPVWLERREAGPRRVAGLLAAAALPLLACGIGLALYNTLRFQNPLEFGQRYQLAGDRQDTLQHFSARYLWFNFRVYFLEPVRWGRAFPFAGGIVSPPLPAGHAPIEDPFGILVNVPLAWLALAAPLGWRERPALRAFGLAGALLFAAAAAPFLLFYGNCSRYEMEFLPALLLLAVLGIFGLERALAARPGWRGAARAGWMALLAVSLAFNLLAAIQRRATERYVAANTLVHFGRLPEAVAQFEAGLRARPAFADAENNLANALLRLGRIPEAASHYAKAAALDPGSPEIHCNFGNLLASLGRLPEAIAQYREALRLRPGYPAARDNLARASALLGEGQGR